MEILLFILAPLLTIALELGVFSLYWLATKNYHKQYIWLSVIAINLLTNAALHIILLLADPGRTIPALELGLEASIIIAEWQLLRSIYPGTSKRWLLLSITMNTASYGVGLLLFAPRWL